MSFRKTFIPRLRRVGSHGALLCAVLCVLVWAVGCSNGTNNDPDGGLNNDPPGYTFTTPEKYRTMVGIAGVTIIGSGMDGVFINERTVHLSAYKIAAYETSWQLWKEVYDWAVKPENGYIFANPGAEGYPNVYTDGENSETLAGKGTDSGAEKGTRPVTMVTWRDVIVWCNAYSELSGKEPVYYTDSSCNTVLKTSTDESGVATAADTAVVKPGANGYRLPTEAEWECAARGGNPSGAAWGNAYAGTNDESSLGTYAWYRVNAFDVGENDAAYGAHPVGTKAQNGAGLYDMSGNIEEWCWDWYGTITTATDPAGAASGSYRMVLGGGWYDPANYCTVAIRFYVSPDLRYHGIGFRVVCR